MTSAGDPESRVLDAIGPETFSFKELVALIGAKTDRNVRLVHLSPSLGIFLGRMIGWFVRDVVLTRDELSLVARALVARKPTWNARSSPSRA